MGVNYRVQLICQASYYHTLKISTGERPATKHGVVPFRKDSSNSTKVAKQWKLASYKETRQQENRRKAIFHFDIGNYLLKK